MAVRSKTAATSMPRDGGRFRPASLDALNFLLADVRGALGPYLNVFLVTQQHWSQSAVGLVTAISGLLGLAVQTPIGAAIDATRAKCALIVAALSVLATGAVTIYVAPYFWHVLVANSLMAVVADVFGPAVAALTLGLYRRAELARRMGRNSAFDHAGNVAIAAVAGPSRRPPKRPWQWRSQSLMSPPRKITCRDQRNFSTP
jgi:MFS family permease